MTTTISSDYEARSVQTATHNGLPVFLFELWELDEGAWYFCGHHSAPRSTPAVDEAELVRYALTGE